MPKFLSLFLAIDKFDFNFLVDDDDDDNNDAFELDICLFILLLRRLSLIVYVLI